MTAPTGHFQDDPWWIHGWTVQNPDGTRTAPEPFPPWIPQLKIQATYMNEQGKPLSGSVLFEAAEDYTDATKGIVIKRTTRRIPIKEGRLRVILPSTPKKSDPAQAFTYSVHECLPGGRKFMIRAQETDDMSQPEFLHNLIADIPYRPITIPRIQATNRYWEFEPSPF